MYYFYIRKNMKFILDLLFNIYAHFPPAKFHFLWRYVQKCTHWRKWQKWQLIAKIAKL